MYRSGGSPLTFKAARVLLYLAIVCVFSSALCSKDTEEEEEEEEVGLVSDQKLTGSSQNRVWQLFLYEEKYLSASNTVDSVVSVGPISNFQHNNHSISFSIGDDVLLNQSNVHLSALYSDGLLQRIFPGLGTWSVGAGGKQLTISPHPRDSDGNGAGGVFEVVYSQDLSANPIFPYPRSLELNLSRSLANNRKMQLFMVLGSF